MSDLGKTNAVWLRYLREHSFFLRLARKLEDDRRKMVRERVQVVNQNDVTSATAHFTSVTLTGVEFGSNTSEAGGLFVRLVANASNWDVHIYTAAGASGEVASITNLAASATGTLVAQNSSGLGGTVTLGATIAAEADDKHQLLVFPDYKLELLKLWPSDGTTDEDTASHAAAVRMLARLASLYGQMLTTVRTGLSEWALSASDNPLARGNRYLEAAESSLLSDTAQKDSSGNVTRLRRGFFEVQRSAQEDETTGSEQDIIKRVIAASAGSFDSNNDGLGTLASHTPEGHCPVGKWRFECVRGVGNTNGGKEEFSGTFTATNSDASFTFTDLRVKQSFKGPLGFGAVTLLRTLSKTGDGSNVNLGAVSTFSTSGESESNTDGGVLYWKTTLAGATNDISFYKSSNMASGDLVAKLSGAADAASTQTAVAQNGSGLSLVFDVGTDPVLDASGTLDLNFFHVQNASNVPDKFEVDTTLTSEGKGSRVLAELFGAYMNTETSGSEQVDDDLIAGANTFVPYIDEDI